MKKFLFVVSLVIAFISCVKIENEPNVEISTNFIKAPSYMDYFPFILVKANEDYTVETNCNWVVINDKVTENGHDKITLKCFMNPTKQKRATTIDIKGEKFYRTVNVIQEGREYKIVQTGDSLYVYSTEPGKLYNLYKTNILNQRATNSGKEKWVDIKKITIEGTTNAMDYACIKQNFENVEYIDISNTIIEAYSGSLGTMDWGNPLDYYAETVPSGAFYYGCCWSIWDKPSDEQMYFSMLKLKSVKLPESAKNIASFAFVGALSLKEIVIPEGLTDIGPDAYIGESEPGAHFSGNVFYNCWSLEKVYLPSTLKFIGKGSFLNCYNLKEVHIAAKTAPSEEIAGNKYMTFGKALDWLNINDWGLSEGLCITAGGWSDYCYEPKTKATLYVPNGCKENYKEWERYFQNIVEE